MKFNYFQSKNNDSALRKFTRSLSSWLITLSPTMSLSLGKKLFLNPFGKRHYEFKNIHSSETHHIKTSLGDAHVSVFGAGHRLIILSHGWADNSSGFEAMISHLISQGFKVAAIDHIAHGKSTGKQTHLLNFIETIRQTIHFFEATSHHIEAIVAHSMGAVATLNLPSDLLENKRLILIAMPINFFELMFEKVDNAGISKKLLTHVLENISEQVGLNWQNLCVSQHSHKLSQNTFFIHDREDKYACYQSVTHYLEHQNSPLFTTQGLGHRKILGDTSVIEHISKVVVS